MMNVSSCILIFSFFSCGLPVFDRLYDAVKQALAITDTCHVPLVINLSFILSLILTLDLSFISHR